MAQYGNNNWFQRTRDEIPMWAAGIGFFIGLDVVRRGYKRFWNPGGQYYHQPEGSYPEPESSESESSEFESSEFEATESDEKPTSFCLSYQYFVIFGAFIALISFSISGVIFVMIRGRKKPAPSPADDDETITVVSDYRQDRTYKNVAIQTDVIPSLKTKWLLLLAAQLLVILIFAGLFGSVKGVSLRFQFYLLFTLYF